MQLRRWRPGLRPDTGSVVHEAYLKLVDQTKVDWQDRNHFYAIAARAMRQVIIDYARKRISQKRGGVDANHTDVAHHEIAVYQQADQLLALDQVLNDLERYDARLLQVVDCRFFAGYSEEETATILNVSSRTVERDWRRAKSWLRQAMSDGARS
jgi:RNA polymerase sigma factor (TIGR02999 family)